jgi:hypothetical protein
MWRPGALPERPYVVVPSTGCCGRVCKLCDGRLSVVTWCGCPRYALKIYLQASYGTLTCASTCLGCCTMQLRYARMLSRRKQSLASAVDGPPDSCAPAPAFRLAQTIYYMTTHRQGVRGRNRPASTCPRAPRLNIRRSVLENRPGDRKSSASDRSSAPNSTLRHPRVHRH